MTDDQAQHTLALASDRRRPRSSKVRTALIGAGAMAVHNYPRQTEDLDLVVSEPRARFRKLAKDLRRRGFQIEMAEPDAQDPLGGVLTISRADAGPVQIVNLDNSAYSAGHPRLGRIAVTTAESHPDLPAPDPCGPLAGAHRPQALRRWSKVRAGHPRTPRSKQTR